MKVSSLFFLFLGFGSVSFANDFLDNLAKGCVNDGTVELVGFGNIELNASQVSGESKYKIGNDYENEVFHRSAYRDANSKYSTLWFYSTVQNSTARTSSDLYWHLIVAPSEIQSSYPVRGYIKDEYMLMSLTHNLISRDDFNYLVDRGTLENGFFLNNPNLNIFEQKEINKIWEKLFTERTMKAVYASLNKDAPRDMDYSFVLHQVTVPLNQINTQRGGFLLPTSKKLIEAGVAHGFVLDHQGSCLAHKTIQIK